MCCRLERNPCTTKYATRARSTYSVKEKDSTPWNCGRVVHVDGGGGRHRVRLRGRGNRVGGGGSAKQRGEAAKATTCVCGFHYLHCFPIPRLVALL